MVIYLLLFILIFYMLICERLVEAKHEIQYSQNNWRNFVLFFCCVYLIFLLCISGFRANYIGADHVNYIDQFLRVEKYGTSYFSDKGEFGYTFVNKLLIKIGGVIRFRLIFLLPVC